MTDATETTEPDPIPWDDPITRGFWAAALDRRFVIQRCAGCGTHQFYPRPFCLVCQSDDVAFVDSLGRGTVYTRTRVAVQVLPDLAPPYTVVLVDLDEGVRMTGNVVDADGAAGADCAIGDRVRIAWRDRSATGLPPLPAFQLDNSSEV